MKIKIYNIERYNSITRQKKVVLKLPIRWVAYQYAKFREYISFNWADFYSVKEND